MQKNHSNLKETEEIWKLNSVYTCKLSWVIKWASVLQKTSLSTWQNWIILVNYINNGFLRWYSGKKKKNVPANAGNARDVDSIPRLGRFPGGGNGIKFQYSCLENPKDRGAWWAIVHEVAKSWTKLSTNAHI